MLYLLTVLTIITSIFIYSFSPRNDEVELWDKEAAKTAVSELVIQHTAAVKAATLKKADNTMAYESWGVTNDININPDKFKDFVAAPFILPGNAISTRICIDNATGLSSNKCGQRIAGKDPSVNKGTTDFIITYLPLGKIEDSYGNSIADLGPKVLGEMVDFAPYSEKAHLETNCGEMLLPIQHIPADFDSINADYILDNSRFESVSIPKAFSDKIKNSDQGILVCITRVSVAYNKDKIIPIQIQENSR